MESYFSSVLESTFYFSLVKKFEVYFYFCSSKKPQFFEQVCYLHIFPHWHCGLRK